MPRRRYHIAPDPCWDTGHTKDGRQVIMGLLCPNLVAIFFDGRGKYVTTEARRWRKAAPTMGKGGPYQIYDAKFTAALAKQVADWQSDLGFTPGRISVEKFETLDSGIEDLPEQLEEPEEDETPSQRRSRASERKEWKASGMFVFYWAEAYWMTRDGEVHSS